MGELYLHNLDLYIEKYKCNQFVETGTGIGTGLHYAAHSQFSKLYSIEIIPNLYKLASQRFETDSRIEIIQNNSIDGLSIILKKLTRDPTIFWLDAHFPGADFHFNNYDLYKDNPTLHMPLELELEVIINNRDTTKDVFIIDDLQLYEDGNFELANPTFVAKYGKKGLNIFDRLLGKSHNFTRDYRHQGFLIALPI